MKYLAALFIAVSLFFVYKLGGFNHYLYYSYCDRPVTYKIGTVDPQFGVSKEEFLKNIKQSEDIWESAVAKNLFEHKVDGELTVNLVFDDRQALKNQIDELRGSVNQGENSIKPELAEFEKRSADFEVRLKALNDKIKEWNAKGGAPKDEYEKLLLEQDSLKKEAALLSDMAKKLNKSADIINSQVGKLNSTISDFKEVLTERPEEGIFDPKLKKIDVYFNINQDELIHTLAHELGHSLGIGHINDSSSIMYFNSTENLKLSAKDTSALDEVCRERSVFEVLSNYAKFLMSKYAK